MHQQEFEGLLAGARLQAGQAIAPQQGLQREQVLLQIVDQQEVDRLLKAGHRAPMRSR